MLVVPHNPLWFCAACFALSVNAVPLDGLIRIVPFAPPAISLTPEGLTRVTVSACEPDVQTGCPVLPVAGVSFDIPAGFEVAAVRVTPGETHEYALAAPVEWGLPPTQPGEALPAVPSDPAIYQASTPYPDYTRPVWRTDPLRETTLLSVQVHPVRFDPARTVLLAAASVTVSVDLRPLSPPVTPASHRDTLATPLAVSPLDSGDPHTYVVVSTSNLIYNAPAPWNFDALCETRARAGFTPAQVTTEWIYSHYAGTNQAAKIRAFVQDACQQWGLRYLLIGGTFDLVPVQKLYVSFYDSTTLRTADIPADAIYYGCMDGSYDGNGNGRYGEVHDGANGGDVDLTAEVMVGRFPVTNAVELAHMVRKTLRYESATAQDLAPNALVAEKMDLGTVVYGTGFMEEIRLGSNAYGLNSLGFESSTYAAAFDTDQTLYDSDTYNWNAADALAFLNQNLQTVNHIGHGATKYCMKIAINLSANQAALQAFTNDMPYFIYSQACGAGGFDTPDCFAEQVVTVSHAACSAIMNARDGWVYRNAVGGYSHRFHRCFWDAALRGNATRFGEINEQSRRMSLHLLSSSAATYWRWVYYELNLFGDPATPFAAAVNTAPPVIAHTPLINTYDTQSLYRVTCTVEPIGIYDPDAVTLVWQKDREPDILRTQVMTRVEGNLHEGFIAPQPVDTRVAYTLYARNHAGYETRWP
ncbi:MAG: C25 family cysteine peptidase, partial [bacterium]